MGPCVGRAILFFPPAPLSAAPTLNQLRLLGFSFLNSFSHGLVFSEVLIFFRCRLSWAIIRSRWCVWEPPAKVQKRGTVLKQNCGLLQIYLHLCQVGQRRPWPRIGCSLRRTNGAASSELRASRPRSLLALLHVWNRFRAFKRFPL